MLQRAKDLLDSLVMMSEEEVSRYFIGAGSSREAYIFEEQYIIKIPRFVVRFPNMSAFTKERVHIIAKKGIKQTETEISIFNSCPPRFKYLLNPIIAHGKFLGMPFVIMPKVKIASNNSPFEIANINQFLEWYDLCVPRSFRHDLVDFAKVYKLYHPDLCENTDNFGVDNENRLLITDYGTKIS